MNERILALVKQADPEFGNDANDMPDAIVGIPAIERFAELIVKECAHVGFGAAYPGKGVDVLVAIKEHFGVDE